IAALTTASPSECGPTESLVSGLLIFEASSRAFRRDVASSRPRQTRRADREGWAHTGNAAKMATAATRIENTFRPDRRHDTRRLRSSIPFETALVLMLL